MVATDDMDGDGQLEVVAMYLSNDTMCLGIYKINADSNLTTKTKFTIKTGIYSSLAMRNFITLNANPDTRPDIAYVHGDSVTILYQKSNGTFSLDSSLTMYSGLSVDGIAKGDFDNDGLDDFVTCNWNTTHITHYHHTLSGSGFYKTHIPAVQAGYNQIKVADVNGDGWDDILFLAGQSMESGVYVKINDNGVFTTTPGMYLYLINQITAQTGITNSVAFGNFLGTGQKFFLSPLSYPNNSVFFNTIGQSDQVVSLPPFGKSTTVADYNNDGIDELAVLTSQSGERLMVIEFSSTGTPTINAFPQQMSGNYSSMDQSIVSGDIIGNDQKIDIITISNDFNGGITIWKNDLVTTEIETQNSLDGIFIYPNPTSDYITISGIDTKDIYQIVMTDSSGRIVLEQQYQGKIDIRKFPKGIYCVKVNSDKKYFSKKIVVQ